MFARPKSLRPTGAKKVVKASSGEKKATTAIKKSPPGEQTKSQAPRKGKVDLFDPASELGRLLRSNFSPTDSQKDEMDQLKTSLDKEARESDRLAVQKRAEILQHESTISRLREEVANLEEKAKKARNNIACASSLLSPIRVLPAEIMGEIFVACLDTEIRPVPLPFVLCRVCTAWRAIARATPALWSKLFIHKPMRFEALTKFATRWFSLSGELPLSLSVLQCNSGSVLLSRPPERDVNDKDVVPLVWERIESLDMRVAFWHEAESFLGSMACVLTKLKYLTVEFQHFEVTQLSQSPSFPRIRRFRLLRTAAGMRGSSTVQDATHFHMPWAQLTHLHMEQLPIRPEVWRSFFRTCRGLVQGSFMLSEDSFPEGQMDLVAFPFLHSLEITFKNNGNWSILKWLEFPSLRSLSIGSMEGLGVWNEVALMNLQAHRLETFTLFKVKVRSAALNEFLHQTPALESLLVHLPLNYMSLLKELTILNDDGSAEQAASNVFLPKLTKLSIYHWRSVEKSMDLDVKVLLEMIKIRFSPSDRHPSTSPGRSLERISVWAWRSGLKFESLKASLRQEKKEGLKLFVGVSPGGYHFQSKLDW
ncbi:hypothetical protein CPB84DRAFT_1711062 [Gymnopilus junonius]|uniref:F-box domain-containing protein n=1 Tax=Gymnopilus junonius TaxID=109634 RepID=A0A9P5NL44_GYMJU|nr:hypothetical protein CPB84DRAFT_1711062 [Gymnopilus junonius]